MKKKFITMALVFVMLFTTTTTTFATLLTEESYPTNGLSEELEKYSYGESYFMIKDTKGDYYVFTRNHPYIDTSNNNKITWNFSKEGNLLCSKYNSKSETWLNTTISKYKETPFEIYVASYCCGNVDVYDQNGDVFFSITPLMPNTQHQIVGGITAKQLQAPLMTILTSLLILVTSLVILAMAFRKGWSLLLTVLKGA